MTVIGHVAREISRFLNFFLKRGGTVTGKVNDRVRKRSPIEQGGLEIHVTVTASHHDEKIIAKLKSLLSVHAEIYSAPLIHTPSFPSKITATKHTSKQPDVHVLSSDDDEPVVRQKKRPRAYVVSSDSD